MCSAITKVRAQTVALQYQMGVIRAAPLVVLCCCVSVAMLQSCNAWRGYWRQSLKLVIVVARLNEPLDDSSSLHRSRAVPRF